jgi:arylformamidase
MQGLLVFIHGGYWRALDKRLFSWIAPPFVAAGLGVANLNYRLCPQVGIADIVEDVVSAVNWLFQSGIADRRVVVAGHSAGGHLVAALFATPRERLAFDPTHIVGGVPISGVFDLEPLPLYSANEDLKLDPASARRLSVHRDRPVIAAPLFVFAGGAETSEFQRQSKLFADAWKPQVRECLILPGLNHFSILDALVERGQPLHQKILSLFSI